VSQFSAPARLPAKLHRRVAFILTDDAVLTEELLARKKLATDISGRLTDRILLIRPGRVPTVVDELKKMGQAPQVVGRLLTSSAGDDARD
jgi:hypothetical protein